MKAIVATAYGGPEVLQYQDIQKPVIGPTDLLVKVITTPATTADAMMRTGKPYFGRLMLGLSKPKYSAIGTGFAGVVEAVGDEVTNFYVGQAVFGETTTDFSANAEYLRIPANGVVLPKPDTLSFEHAATYCDGPLTSYYFLAEIAALQPGQKILINGASGALGTAAVQLAKYFGAEVTAVCSSWNVGLVRELGADRIIDYTSQDFTKGDYCYDFIFDTVGKSSFTSCRKVLNLAGQFLSPVLNMRLLLDMAITSVFSKRKAKFAAVGLKENNELKQLLSSLVDIQQKGELSIVIDRQYPLGKAAEAHRYIDTGRKKGNVILRVAEA